MKTLFALLLLLLLWSGTVWAQRKSTVSNDQYVGQLIVEATRSHPRLEAETERTEAALAAIGSVRLWEDPQVGLGVTAAERSMRMGDGDIRLSVDQMLPRRGLYRAETRRAAADQQKQASLRQVTANELALSVAQSALELALADDVITLQREELGWLKTIVTTAQERAKNPDGSATESLRVEGELALREQKLAAAQRQRAQVARTLNILLGRDVNSDVGLLTLPKETPFRQDFAELKNRLESSPQLSGSRSAVEGALAEVDAAREKRKPVYSVGVESNAYSGGELRDAMFMVRITLPWFNRKTYDADLLRTERLQAAAQKDLAAQQRELFTRITDLVTEAENNRQNALAYGLQVLPRTERALEITQGAWVSSKATLLEVLDARRALLDAKQEQKRSLAAHHVAIHSIDALTGTLAKSTTEK